MKKLLFILLFGSLSAFGQSVTFTNIATGSAANDGAGDTLRTMAIKINAGFLSVSNNIATNSAASKLNRASDSATNITFVGTNLVTADGGLVSRSLEKRFGEAFDARDRVSSGTALDHATELQALLDDAGEHAVIQLGRGNYNSSTSLKFRTGQKIRGMAGGPQFGTPTNLVTRITFTGATAGFEPFDRDTNTFNVEISNIDIAGNDSTSTIGIDLYRTSNAEVRGCVVHGFQYGIVADANISNQAYFNNVTFNEFGYNSVAGVVYKNGANANLTLGNKISGNPYGLIQTNAASGNSSISDNFQGVSAPNATIFHVWSESGVLKMVSPYIEVATGAAITNSVGGRLEVFAPTFGGGLTNFIMSGVRQMIGDWTQPITGSQGYRGVKGTLRLTNDWFSSANNFIMTLDPKIRDDLSASTALNYLINYGSDVVSGDSAWIFYGNNVGGTQNTNAIVRVNLKGDGGIELAEFGELVIDGFRLHRGEGSGEASIQQDVSGSYAYALRASRTNVIVNNLVVYTNVTANGGAFTNSLTLGGATVSVVGHAHAGEDITSGTVAEPRIASTLTRDAEIDSEAEIEAFSFGGGNVLKEADIDTQAEFEALLFALPSGGGSQTPWTSDIDADGFSLTNVAQIVTTGSTPMITIPTQATPTTDADGEIANDEDGWGSGFDALEYFDGTASRYIVATTASDAPTNGQVPKWNTGGTITWEDDNEGAGGADADAIHDNVGGEIAAIADKATPVAADHLLIEDSAASDAKKDITVGSLGSALEGVMDLQDLQGTLTRAKGGTGADTSAYGTGLLGSDGSNNTIDIDTESELETSLGGINLLNKEAIDTEAEFEALLFTLPGGAGGGDVSGPAASTDNGIVRFDGTGGKTIQDSGILIDDIDNLDTPGSVTIQDLLILGGATSPAEITSNQNNYKPLTNITTVRLSSDAARDITGLDGNLDTGLDYVDGIIRILHNVGSFPITLKDENASSTSNHRFALQGDVIIDPDESFAIRYDITTDRWRPLSDEVGSITDEEVPDNITINQATLALGVTSANDPDISTEGRLGWDANGDVLRAYDGANQVAIGRKRFAIHFNVVLPNDLADSERDAFWIWENTSGMSFIVTGWSFKSDTDDTTLNIEEIDNDGANNATVDAVEIATNGTGLFYASDTTITAATIEDGHLLVIDFDDTDTPGQVKGTIYGYFNADVN